MRTTIWPSGTASCPRRCLERLPGHLFHQYLALDGRQNPAAMKRIEEHLLVTLDRLDNEVPRQADADNRKPGPRGHRHHNGRQRDGNPGASIENVIEIAVVGVVVCLDVAAKTHVMEKVPAQAADARSQIAVQEIARFVSHAGQLVQIRLDIELGVFVASQLQRDFREVVRSRRVACQKSECRIELHSSHQCSW